MSLTELLPIHLCAGGVPGHNHSYVRTMIHGSDHGAHMALHTMAALSHTQLQQCPHDLAWRSVSNRPILGRWG